MLSLFSAFAYSATLLNRTTLKYYQKDVYSVSIPGYDHIEYYVNFDKFTYFRIANIIEGSYPSNVNIGFTTTGGKVSAVSTFTYTNPGFVFASSTYNQVRVEIRNTGWSSQSFKLAIGVINVSSSSTKSFFTTSDYDCFMLKRDGYATGSSDYSFTNSEEITYMNIHNTTADRKYSVNVYISNSYSYFDDSIYYVTQYGKDSGIYYKGSNTILNPVIRFKSYGYYTDSRVDAIEILVRNRDKLDKEGVYCNAYGNAQFDTNCNYRYSKVCYEFSESSEKDDSSYLDEATNGLAIAVAVYAAIVGVLLVLNIIMACMYPNRLYRLGITCSCCYCCCADHYYYSNTYYSTHYYARPCFCFCGNCDVDCNSGGSDSGNAAVFILLLVVLIILILLAFILMFTLYSLCVAADEEERRWENENIRSKKPRSNDTTVVVINNQQQPLSGSLVDSNSQPMMYPQQQMMYPQQQMAGQQQMMYQQPMGSQPMVGQQQPMMYPPPMGSQPMVGQQQQQPMMYPPPMVGQQQPTMPPQPYAMDDSKSNNPYD